MRSRRSTAARTPVRRRSPADRQRTARSPSVPKRDPHAETAASVISAQQPGPSANRVPNHVPDSENMSSLERTCGHLKRLSEPKTRLPVRLRNRRSGVRIPSGALRSSPLLAVFAANARHLPDWPKAALPPLAALGTGSPGVCGRMLVASASAEARCSTRREVALARAGLAASFDPVRTRNRATASLPWNVGVLLRRRESRAMMPILVGHAGWEARRNEQR
jgi:hypothetical protein